mgnify:CR=1 FL=1
MVFDAPITTIGTEAFRKCINLTTIAIPKSITLIEDLAFCECSNLISITIPDNVRRIETFVFADCKSLKSFHGRFASSDNRCLIDNGNLISFAAV